MSKDMKVIMERWDRFVVKEEKNPEWVTWAFLSDAIDLAIAMKKGEETTEREKKIAKLAGKEGLKLAVSTLLPVVGPFIAAGVDATGIMVDMVKTYAQEDDSKTKTNPVLDLFNLDDGFEDLIDDRIEDKFIKKMMDDLPDHIANHPNQKVPDFDNVIRAWLHTFDLSGVKTKTVIKQDK